MVFPPQRRKGRKLLSVTLGGASLTLVACTPPHGVLTVPDGGGDGDASTPMGRTPGDAGDLDAHGPFGVAPYADGGAADSGTPLGVIVSPDAGDPGDEFDARGPFGVSPSVDGGNDAGN
jgi:hypothetical protein